MKNALYLLFLLVVELLREHDFEADIQVAFAHVVAHVVLLVVYWHALAFDHFDCLRSDHLVDCQEHASPVQQRNFDRLALYGILKGDLVSIDQVALLSHVPGGHGVRVVEARGSCLEVYEQV